MDMENFKYILDKKTNARIDRMTIEYKTKYISIMKKEIDANLGSASLSMILKNKEKLINIDFTNELLGNIKSDALSAMEEAGIAESRRLTLWNKAIYNVPLPKIDPIEIKLPSDSSHTSDGQTADKKYYIVGGVGVAAIIAAILAHIATTAKAAAVTAGSVLTFAGIKGGLSQHAKEKKITSDFFDPQISKACMANTNVYKGWIYKIAESLTEIVGCE